MTEYELTQLADAVGIDPIAFIRDVATPRLSEADQNDRVALGRDRYKLSGLALAYFVENALPAAKPQEAKRLPAPKPKPKGAPQEVKLRENDVGEAEIEAQIQATLDYIYGRRS
jgi:hypothetical protein